FEGWITKELRYLSGGSSLNLRKLTALSQDSLPRLVEPLLLYAIQTGKVDALLSFVWREEIRASYSNALAILGDCSDLGTLALSDSNSVVLPREYGKYLTSYRTAYNKPETDAESKRMRWERSRDLQLKKGVSNAAIYNALGLNPGNVNAYMKHGALDKVSLQNSTAIMKYLYALD
ncbi:MAG: hypothetical protein RR505_13825, partial [Raoultibacter sp.]